MLTVMFRGEGLQMVTTDQMRDSTTICLKFIALQILFLCLKHFILDSIIEDSFIKLFPKLFSNKDIWNKITIVHFRYEQGRERERGDHGLFISLVPKVL